MIDFLPLHLIDLGPVELQWIAFSALLFFAGYASSRLVWDKEIDILMKYPKLVWGWVKRNIAPDDPWIKLFVFLFAFNTLSLLVNSISGLLVFVPFLFAFLLGLHLGIISIEETGKPSIGLMVLNPVAWLELPASWISLAIGMQLGFSVIDGTFGYDVFVSFMEVFAYLVIPLLLLAALIEATLIYVFPSKDDLQEDDGYKYDIEDVD